MDELGKSDVRSIKYFEIDNEEKWKATLLNEVIDARDATLHVDGFNEEEMQSLIEFLCTS